MIFKPFLLSGEPLPENELAQDKKNAVNFDRCGVGEKALYMGNFFIDRMYYAPICQIKRAYKRIAMTKGGFNGQGAFGTMSYLVVDFIDGSQKVSIFKREEQVDKLIAYLKSHHPQIDTVSPKVAKQRLEAEKSRLVYTDAQLMECAGEKQKQQLQSVNTVMQHLNKKPELYKKNERLAKELRKNQMTGGNNKWIALAIVVLGVAAAVHGIVTLMNREEFAVYFLMFGLAAIFLFSATAVMPTAKKNREILEASFEKSQQALIEYVNCLDLELPLPAPYAHPLILQRIKDKMAASILTGDDASKGYDCKAAFDDIKAELQRATKDVKVSQADYDFIVAVKPIFLVREYK